MNAAVKSYSGEGTMVADASSARSGSHGYADGDTLHTPSGDFKVKIRDGKTMVVTSDGRVYVVPPAKVDAIRTWVINSVNDGSLKPRLGGSGVSAPSGGSHGSSNPLLDTLASIPIPGTHKNLGDVARDTVNTVKHLPVIGGITPEQVGHGYNAVVKTVNNATGQAILPTIGSSASRATVLRGANSKLAEWSNGAVKTVDQLAEFNGKNAAANGLRARLDRLLGGGVDPKTGKYIEGNNSLGITSYKQLMSGRALKRLGTVVAEGNRPVTAAAPKTTPTRVRSQASGSGQNGTSSASPRRSVSTPPPKPQLQQVVDGVIGEGKDVLGGLKNMLWDQPQRLGHQLRNGVDGVFSPNPIDKAEAQENFWAGLRPPPGQPLSAAGVVDATERVLIGGTATEALKRGDFTEATVGTLAHVGLLGLGGAKTEEVLAVEPTPIKPAETPPQNPLSKVSDPLDASQPAIPAAKPMTGHSEIVPFRNNTTGSVESPVTRTPPEARPNVRNTPPGTDPLSPTAASTAVSPRPRTPSGSTATLPAPVETSATPSTRPQPVQAPSLTPEPAPEPSQVLPDRRSLGTPLIQPSTKPDEKPAASGNEASRMPVTATAFNPGSRPGLSVTESDSNGYSYSPEQFRQTDFDRDVLAARGGPPNTGGPDQPVFYFLRINETPGGVKGDRPSLVSVTNPDLAQSYVDATVPGTASTPQNLYIGRLPRSEEPVVLGTPDKKVDIAMPFGNRSVLNVPINSVEDFRDLIKVAPDNSGLTLGASSSPSLRFSRSVPPGQAQQARDAFAQSATQSWLQYRQEAIDALNSGRTFGAPVAPKNSDVVATRYANTKMDATLRSDLPGNRVSAIERWKNESTGFTMSNLVMRNKVDNPVFAATDWLQRGTITAANNPIQSIVTAATVGTAAHFGLQIIGADLNVHNTQKGEDLALKNIDAAETLVQTTPKAFDSPKDNPEFQKKWGNFVVARAADQIIPAYTVPSSQQGGKPTVVPEQRLPGSVTQWSDALIRDPNTAASFRTDVQNFYKGQFASEASQILRSFKSENADQIKISSDILKVEGRFALGQSNAPWVTGYNHIERVNGILSTLQGKYTAEQARILDPLSTKQSTVGVKSTLENNYVPPNIVAEVAKVSPQVDLAKASQVPSPPQRGAESTAPITAAEAQSQKDRIAAAYDKETGLITQALTAYGGAKQQVQAEIQKYQTANPGKPIPIALGNLASSLESTVEPLRARLTQIPQARDQAINAVNVQFQNQRAQAFGNLNTKAGNIQSQIDAITAVESDAASKAGASKVSGAENPANWVLKDGFYQVKPSFLARLKDYFMSGGASTLDIEHIVQIDHSRLKNDAVTGTARAQPKLDSNGALIPQNLNTHPLVLQMDPLKPAIRPSGAEQVESYLDQLKEQLANIRQQQSQFDPDGTRGAMPSQYFNITLPQKSMTYEGQGGVAGAAIKPTSAKTSATSTPVEVIVRPSSSTQSTTPRSLTASTSKAVTQPTLVFPAPMTTPVFKVTPPFQVPAPEKVQPHASSTQSPAAAKRQ